MLHGHHLPGPSLPGAAPPEETVVSQLARLIFGGGLLYYEIQVVTMLILVFAANTAFADFPRLAFFLARDGFIPRQFGTRGDRLVFSNGILILGGLAALLIVLFGGATHALIPLYAVGVFVSFTLSQASMVRRWLSRREPGWSAWRWMLNAVGAATTGVVMVVIASTKFSHGAWMVVVLIPTMVALFRMIRRHYADVAGRSPSTTTGTEPDHHTMLVLTPDVHPGVMSALQYARSASEDVRAVYVEINAEATPTLAQPSGRIGAWGSRWWSWSSPTAP